MERTPKDNDTSAMAVQMSSSRHFVQASNQAVDPGLACSVGTQVAGQRIDEGWYRKQFSHFGTEVLANGVRLCSYFGDDRGASVDDEDDVFQIMASEEVGPAASAERLDLGSQEMRGGDHADFQLRRQSVLGSGVHRGPIPAIRKSENPFIERHDVKDQFSPNPSAKGCVLTKIFGESERAKAVAECGVLCIRSDFRNGVHVQRRARSAGAVVRHEQARDGTSHEHEVVEHRTQDRGSRDQLLKI